MSCQYNYAIITRRLEDDAHLILCKKIPALSIRHDLHVFLDKLRNRVSLLESGSFISSFVTAAKVWSVNAFGKALDAGRFAEIP